MHGEYIRRHAVEQGTATVIEVCNGISGRKLDDKIDEAYQGKQVIEKLTGVPTYAAIIFYRHKKLQPTKDPRLNHLCQLKKIHTEEAITALRAIQNNPKADQQQVSKTLALITAGHPIDRILYPEDWEKFKKEFPELARGIDLQKYNDRIAGTKAVFLERYAGNLMQRLVRGKVFTNVEYTPIAEQLGLRPKAHTQNGMRISYGGRGELDIIVTATEEDIRNAFANQEFTLIK